MPCFHPIDGYRSSRVGPSGKRQITFTNKEAFTDLPIQIPCGQCIGCRLEKSRQWALRCTHEAQLYQNNCFITLTYNDDLLPENSCLQLKHFQLFMKKLRKKYIHKIRFYHCGEYGSKTLRPHYHALLFNHDFQDKILHSTREGNKYYVSQELNKLWTYGFSIIGELTFDSAAYVARYCLKKHTGPRSHELYLGIDKKTGEIFYYPKEYATMSRRPGIGSGWYEKFKSDVYPDDFVVHDGIKMRAPKFYDGKLEKTDRNLFDKITTARMRDSAKRAHENTPARLAVRETVQRKRAERLKRGMENEE